MTSSPALDQRFLPLETRSGGGGIARPPMSYWRHVGLRFGQNRLGVVALATVLALAVMVAAGPLLWPIDPSLQRIGSRSLGPSPAREAQLVIWRPWRPAPALWRQLEAPLGFAAANTEFVRLYWRPIAGAAGYAIYRRVGAAPADSPGIPLGEIEAHELPHYEDRLDLGAQRYGYTILARDGAGGVLGTLSGSVRPSLAVGLLEAQLEGLVPIDGASDGQPLALPAHPLGTDHLGRDVLARLLHGGRTSLFIGVFAPLCFVLCGALYGGVAGYAGGRLDNLLMRVADFVVALPFLLFMILFRVLFGIGPGESGIAAMMLAMVLLNWPATARLVRGQVLQLRGEAFVDAARLFGGGPVYIIFRHLLPNVTGVLLVSLSFAIPAAIFTEAFLSFIGLGVAPPAPSWGSMCNDGIRTLLSSPHELLFPALAISLTVLAFNLLGDALRDAFDIRLRAGVGSA